MPITHGGRIPSETPLDRCLLPERPGLKRSAGSILAETTAQLRRCLILQPGGNGVHSNLNTAERSFAVGVEASQGQADSATTLEEDRLPLTSADLKAWLWRIDLVVELVAKRASQLSRQQLDWMPPDGGWSLRQILHHLASAEMYYAIWLDEELPEEPVTRYEEANRRFGEQVQQILASPEQEDTAFFEAGAITSTTVEHIVREALATEHRLSHEE